MAITCLQRCMKRFSVSKRSFQELIPPTVDVVRSMQSFHSCRRGSLTHARNMGVVSKELDVMNRWRLMENGRGRQPKEKWSSLCRCGRQGGKDCDI